MARKKKQKRDGAGFLRNLFDFFTVSSDTYTSEQQNAVITGTSSTTAVNTSTAAQVAASGLLADLAANQLQVSKNNTSTVDEITELADGTIVKYDGKRWVKHEPNGAYVSADGILIDKLETPVKTLKAGGTSYNPAAKTLIINI